jgi:L-asparaginase / beta-aspartyl-peptidase
MNRQEFALAIHGGAGTILPELMTSELQTQYEQGLEAALEVGRSCLAGGGSALDAVTQVVMTLEDFPLFNAGRGSVFNHIGGHEMDAAIMDGATQEAGAVCGVTGVRNPVVLAKLVMQHSGHVMLAGAGAEEFGRLQGVEFKQPEWFHVAHRYQQWQDAMKEDVVSLDHSGKKFGTVGAVALDKAGNMAAATSTGGMTNKRFGRVGDTPIIGAGTYAHNATCAVSCTGHGELFIRAVVAYDVACLMAYAGLSLQAATDRVVMEKLVEIGGEGGLIAIDSAGNMAMPFNSAGMYRACCNSSGLREVRIYRD